MSKIPDLQKKVLGQATSPCMGHYVWKHGIGPQMGYSFSIIHALAYSFIGFQTAYLATRWNPIYWNTACLVVNSGSLEDEENVEMVGIYEPEDWSSATYEDLPDRSGKKKIEKATDYAKVSKALGDILTAGIKVSLVDINKSGYSFKPDADNNEILFGMKALSNVSGPTIDQIISGRPYVNFLDFLARCPLNKSAMISLIKAGAFDKLEKDWAKELGTHPRYLIMTYYLSKVSEPKSRLTLQNFNGLVKAGLIPEELDFQKRLFGFNKYLKDFKKVGKYYVFDEVCLEFYSKFFSMENLEVINGYTCILQAKWEKIYKAQMDAARDWLKDHQEETLKQFNTILFREQWDKYAQGNLSAWEMESLCFYYHEHELADVDCFKYGITNFFELSPEPIVEKFFKRNGKDIPIFKTFKIIGTVISKNDNKATVSLLTPNGVVDVKFTKEYYAMFGRQISEKQEDGTKKVMEKGWFTRGSKLMVTGMRRDDMFVAKSYTHTPTHQLYKIELTNNGRDMELVHDRYGIESEDKK
jgi:DNA polymerase-3 subunit alpha